MTAKRWFKVTVSYKGIGDITEWDTIQAKDWRDAIDRMANALQMLPQSFTHAEAHEVGAPAEMERRSKA